MFLHPNAVAQDGSARVRAGGIDRNDSDHVIVFSIEARQVIDQGALPCSRGARQANHASLTAVGKQGFQQIGPTGSTVLDRGNRACEGANVSGTKGVDPQLNVGIRGSVQPNSVKQDGGLRNSTPGPCRSSIPDTLTRGTGPRTGAASHKGCCAKRADHVCGSRDCRKAFFKSWIFRSL
jgi:hypothetical protein